MTDDQKTHKNPELRGSSVVKESDLNKNKKSPAPVAKAAAVQKPPKLQLDGKKWLCVSFSSNEKSLMRDVVITLKVTATAGAACR